MGSLLKAAFEKRGLKQRDLLRKKGICYAHAARQFNGERPVSAAYALKYEKIFGIPRFELRPDLWPAPATKEENMVETITALLTKWNFQQSAEEA